LRAALLAACAVVASSSLSVLGCSPDGGPEGLRRAVKTGGPTVVFDLVRRPVPELPLPNDVATWPDPSSRTGRRLDPSLLAPTAIEQRARAQLARLEGFGTFSTISIPFDAPLDVADIAARHAADDYELTNDAVYLVDISPGSPRYGVPVPLDVGAGNHPTTLASLQRYWPNDPQGGESNLLFETREEDRNGNGVLDPGEDTDFDGVLDHPNFPGGVRPANGVDGLLDFYESESRTLLMRPMLPLDEATEYAVVVTDRLHGTDAAHTAVQSPFDWIHHPSQARAAGRLADAMAKRPEFYGFDQGSALDHVQFLYTFTTQPTASDLFALRDGIWGHGASAWIAEQYPAQAKLLPMVGLARPGETDPANWQTTTECKDVAKARRTIVPTGAAAFQPVLKQLVEGLLGLSGPAAYRLEQSFDSVDHVAIATVKVPWLLGDHADVSPDATIALDPATGAIPHSDDEVQLYVVVPTKTALHAPPFPVALYGHGYASDASEALLYAGELARHGIATVAINYPGHGRYLSPAATALAAKTLRAGCLVPFASALSRGRLRDLDGDGSLAGESGADFFTAYVFHTRDMVRQAVFDQMFVTRVIAGFDGVNRYDQDGDGQLDVAGDFDGDGVPDIGGTGGKPGAIYAWGESLGGIVASIQGGIDPTIVAAAPTAGGGALTDVGLRSTTAGVAAAVTLRALGPLVISVPAEGRIDWRKDDQGNPALDAQGKPIPLADEQQTRTACHGGQTSVRWVVVDGMAAKELEIACLEAGQVVEGADVVVTNGSTSEARCAKITKASSDYGVPSFRVPIPAGVGDAIAISIFAPRAGRTQVLDAYGTSCAAPDGLEPTFRIDTWRGLGTACGAGVGATCVAFRGAKYAIGSPLVAPAEGFGLRRQSPEFRRFLDLAQTALDPADPLTFAPYYFVKPRLDVTGAVAPATALLSISTIGDSDVPVSAGIAFARVAGAMPFLRPTGVAAKEYPDYVAPQDLVDLFQKTPNQLLLDNDVIEGVARLGRSPAGATCKRNWNVALCGGSDAYDPTTCQNALFDVDDLSEGALRYAQQRLSPPLRVARLAKHATLADLGPIWTPRTQAMWTPSGPLAASLLPYVTPTGAHGFAQPDPCKLWDDGSYLINTIAHFFRSGGSDLYYLSHPATHPCAATSDPTNGCDWGE
jgi:hypothetical protein